LIEVVGFLAAAEDRDRRARNISIRLRTSVGSRRSGNIRRQIVGLTEMSLGHCQSHYAAFDVRLPLLKIADFPGANGWKREWQNRINETRQVPLSELATERDAIEFPEKGN
jgi:hypothetical protein